MTLKNIIYTNGFVSALSRLMSEKLPVATSYALAKLVKSINNQGDVFSAERLRIYQEHGDESSDTPGNWELREEEREAGLSKLKELVDIEEDHNFKKVSLPEDVVITTDDLMLLEEVLVLK